MTALREALRAAQASAAAALTEAERLDATVKALGGRLVAAERDRDLAARSEARESAEAAEGRVAAAASAEAMRQSMRQTMHLTVQRETQRVRDEVVKQAGERFATAREEYVKIVADRDRLRRDFDDLRDRSERDLEKKQHDIDKLRLKHKDRSDSDKREIEALQAKAHRLQASNNDLLLRTQKAEQDNSRLNHEIADLRAISDELIAIAENCKHQQQRTSMGNGRSDDWEDNSSCASSSARTDSKAGFGCATPGGLRDLTL